ncbi:MAG: chemotaxis protein [bacterium]|nr:MAG: chemotaxis protein [bacterium]
MPDISSKLKKSDGEKPGFSSPPDDDAPSALKEAVPAGKEGAPPWIVTFADLTTLMLTFFVLLLSFANTDIVRFKEMMGSMQDAFGATRYQKGAHKAAGKVGSLAEKLGIRAAVVIDPEKREQEAISELVYDAARRTGLMNNIQIFFGRDGMSLRMDGSVMFAAGSAVINEKVMPFLDGIAKIMKSYSFNLFIEGHTDTAPISTKKFPSNWELSTVRATTVLRRLLDAGVMPDRLAATGYADRKPLRENNTPENRAINRRVEFKFVRVQL